MTDCHSRLLSRQCDTTRHSTVQNSARREEIDSRTSAARILEQYLDSSHPSLPLSLSPSLSFRSTSNQQQHCTKRLRRNQQQHCTKRLRRAPQPEATLHKAIAPLRLIMPTIILKKTFKVKPSGFQVATEKSFSFHGSAVTTQLVQAVNQKLQSLRYTHSAKVVQFGPDKAGHYYGTMNHDCQKHHEEDVICAILDTMEILGWTFRFQYDSESSSAKMTGSSFTSRELFLFHKGA